MANKFPSGETVVSQQPPRYQQEADEPDDLTAGSGAPVALPSTRTAVKTTGMRPSAPGEGQFVVEEVPGQVRLEPLGGGESAVALESHDEIGTDGAEAGEEYAEATAEQMAAESVEESAFSDLRGVEGFESIASEESTAVNGAAPSLLPDAGAATEAAQQEFLPILAKLAPILISTVGPAVAKAVSRKLSPHARRVLQSRHVQAPALALIKQLLQKAEQQPGPMLGESGMEVDGALVEETAQLLEVIIGTDDRVRLTRTERIPWRFICALRIQMPSGATYRGTGFLIGPRALATAGHCVYLHNQGGWARRIEVIPGCNGSQKNFGSTTSSSFRSVKGWTRDKKPESDYGCIVLDRNAFGGQSLGHFGFAAFSTSVLLAKPAVLVGYPGDKPFAELWGMGRRIKAATSDRLVYDIDTVGGQSGAPVYIKPDGKRYIVGIHNYGASSGNSATRVTQAVFQNLLKWSKLGR